MQKKKDSSIVSTRLKAEKITIIILYELKEIYQKNLR